MEVLKLAWHFTGSNTRILVAVRDKITATPIAFIPTADMASYPKENLRKCIESRVHPDTSLCFQAAPAFQHELPHGRPDK